MEPSAELHRPGLAAKLNKTMYGTQDASTAWQKLCGEHLRSNGFELGASNPALYRSELVNGYCHGDDIVTAAAEGQIEIFGKMLQGKFDTRRIGMIGPAKHLDKTLEVLYRSVRVISDELMEIAAGQKHVPKLLEDLALTQGNVVKTPRVKLSAAEAHTIENSPIVEGEQATLFRSGTMRFAFFGARSCRHFWNDQVSGTSNVETNSWSHDAIENVPRNYLKGVPRKAQQYAAQEPSRSHLEAHVDSDHGNASKHVWSDHATWTTLAQTQLNGTKRDWSQ